MKHLLNLLFVTFSLNAQDLQPSAMLLQKGHIVKSTSNGKIYQLYVSLPVGYDADDFAKYPVLYVLDAYYSYPLLYSMHKLLDNSGDIERIIIVAVGDEDQSNRQWLISRTLDYTPSSDSFADTDIARGAGLDIFAIKSGGARAFLKTIREDIMPFIEKTYRTTADRGIAGHSLGGLFAGYCLLNEPDLFTRFGMSSPSFLWDRGEIINSLKFARIDSKAKIFISEGSLEPKVMSPFIKSFIDGIKDKNLSLTYHLFENETHASVMAASMSRMLRVLYSAK